MDTWTADARTDADLQLGRLKAGDREAMTFVVQRLYNRMLRAAYHHLDRREEAENAVQDALTRVWLKRDRLPAEWVQAVPYILRIAENAAYDIGRRAEAKLKTFTLDEPGIEIAAPISADRDEPIEEIVGCAAERLMPLLKDRQRRLLAVVARRLSQPHTANEEVYRDAGETLGLAWASVRNEWSRLGQLLRGVWPNDLGDDAVRELLRRIGLRLDSVSG